MHETGSPVLSSICQTSNSDGFDRLSSGTTNLSGDSDRNIERAHNAPSSERRDSDIRDGLRKEKYYQCELSGSEFLGAATMSERDKGEF